MKLRLKILLLAAVPLLAAMAAITVAVYLQGLKLAQMEKQVVETAWLGSKESELRHYVSLAYSAVAPLQEAGDDPATRQRALDLLAQMEFGRDGYFFVYDLQGKNLMHPRQPDLVGRELWDLRDTQDQPVIQNLLAAARRGGQQGEAVHYLWERPSTHQNEEKLGYVVVLERWGWMLGTGIYLDDVNQALQRIDAAAQANIRDMFAWVAGIAAVCILGVAACGLALNISDHRQSDAKLRLMARQLVRTQEDERARLSRELHDGISQVLVSIKLSLEAARERLRQALGAEPRALAHIDAPLGGALDRLNNAVGEVRRISHNLRPTLLDDLGLPAALEHLGREFSQPSQHGVTPLAVRLHTDGHPVKLPDAYATALFRVTQEALTNVLRHAGATRAEMVLTYGARDLTLSIADDGHGFDHAEVQQDPRRGIGLRNMRERMAALSGTLVLHSGVQGTLLKAWLPLPAAGALSPTHDA
ncbi:cache domain-containing protein [Achromobacter sp. Marseille-Q0513]|uniref:cache domain-containing protein n=1 Tax=Achromobacter sp. Marseille-Q0513 TaxID=2829161 RepID=UPI001B9330E2|nr:cache domain-containing protein [Achromobacter sp. Marseille-Q0513]MBR8655282.1 cache domain-containing protein [Achromobacter sp. Marseille-Q0513]